jgi:hypothetical protein
MRGQLGSKKTPKERAAKTEKELAKNLGGIPTPNSGALDNRKGDVVLPDFLLESKETEHLTYRIAQSDLRKITKEARETNKDPAFSVTFHSMKFGTPKTWVLIPLGVFDELRKTVQ